MNADGVVPIDRSYVGPATVLVPNEDILVVVTDLPFASRRQREAAAPFAVEGLIGQPLDEVHVAVGIQMTERRHLCAVVGRNAMARWVDVLNEAGLDRAILLPDALMLPVPPLGHWYASVEGARVRVRADDGSGFATPVEHLGMAWEAAGRPGILNMGEALPSALVLAEVELLDLPASSEAGPGLSLIRKVKPPIPAVDLLQGPFAGRGKADQGQVRMLAMIVGIGLAAHLAIFTADTLALNQKANQAQVRVEALKALEEGQPPGAAYSSLGQARAVPLMGGTDGPFLAGMGRVSEAISGQDVTLRSLSYARGEPLELALSVPDAPALERAVDALRQNGLSASSELDSRPDNPGQEARLGATIRIGHEGGSR